MIDGNEVLMGSIVIAALSVIAVLLGVRIVIIKALSTSEVEREAFKSEIVQRTARLINEQSKDTATDLATLTEQRFDETRAAIEEVPNETADLLIRNGKEDA